MNRVVELVKSNRLASVAVVVGLAAAALIEWGLPW